MRCATFIRRVACTLLHQAFSAHDLEIIRKTSAELGMIACRKQTDAADGADGAKMDTSSAMPIPVSTLGSRCLMYDERVRPMFRILL